MEGGSWDCEEGSDGEGAWFWGGFEGFLEGEEEVVGVDLVCGWLGWLVGLVGDVRAKGGCTV